MPKRKSIQATQKAVTTDDRQISKNLSRLMEEHSWSIQGMASALNISVTQMRKYMFGSNRISAGRLAKIAELMQLDIAMFYGEELVDAE